MANTRKLRRSDDRRIAGVCGGLAEYLDVPAGRVRFAYVLLSTLSAGFPGVLVYCVLWYLLPRTDARFRLEDFRVQ